MATNNSINEPTAASGKVLQGQGVGTASAFSTATYPSVGTSTGTILRADGTNWVASTSTYPNTNAINTLLYASSANVMSALATANSSVLVTDGSGVPSLSTALPNGVTATTQAAADNSTKVATTAYVASATTFVKQVRGTTTAATLCTTVLPSDNTIPQSTEGDQILTVSITPSNANNILVIQWQGFVGGSTVCAASVALFQDSTANALNATQSVISNTNYVYSMSLIHTMTAGTTSSTTFKLRMGPSSTATLTLNGSNSTRTFGGVATSVILVSEYTA